MAMSFHILLWELFASDQCLSVTLGEPEASEPLSLIVRNDYSIDQAHRHIGNAPPDINPINSTHDLTVGTRG